MAGYIGTKAVNLSTTGADINGNANVDGTLDVTGAFTSLGIDDNAAATAVTIDASGNVGIGTASPNADSRIHVYGADVNNKYIRTENNNGTSYFGTIGDGAAVVESNTYTKFTTGGSYTERMRITSTGAVGIGTAAPSYPLDVTGTIRTTANFQLTANDSYLGFSANGMFAHNANDLVYFKTGAAERMRIDASGNLLVGKTISDFNTQGFEINSGGQLRNSRASGAVAFLNRKTDDGSIVDFGKDGVAVGSIGGASGDLYLSGTTAGVKVYGAGILACNSSGANADNQFDVGALTVRWDDIYATNGTIQTSDRNEKEAIASLTPTEMLVAARLSSSFKNFKWKDAVAEKGAAARMHSGIIAQDVQDAFAAEGLDAGAYSMFISGTWWEHDVDVPAVEAVAEVVDEDGVVVTEAVEAVAAYTRTDTYETLEEAPEGATERTRLGVRYPELLAFVAAYSDQRFISIETRLAALEATP